MSALFKNKDEDLVKIYKYPTMYSVESTKRLKGDEKQVQCYEDIFNKGSTSCEEVYITGDTGVGKTSFCSRMCYLWCLSKTGGDMKDKSKALWVDIDHMSKYEFVFYISLRDTYHTRVIDIIIEQLLQNDKAKYKENLDDILHKHQCLVIMDGLDEWCPKVDGKQKYELPERIYSNTCVYLTTSRPYRILTLSHKSDIDHHIQMSGIHGKSSKSYVSDVIEYLNKENSDDRKLSDFESFVRKCCFEDQLCIPMTAAHLVILWFENVLVEMPKAFVYANILEMFFKRAKKKEIEFPPPTSSTFHLPNSFSQLKYSNQYASLLYKVCHLSFRLLFKHASSFIFTPDQLENEPYCFSDTEIHCLCKIGILSKNEVYGCYSEEKLRISFLHKSYLEFFSALYISKYKKIDFSEDVIKKWRSLNDFLQFKNVFVLLAGFSPDSVVYFDIIQSSLSDYLNVCRSRAIFHYDSNYYYKQMESLQAVVIDCFKEIKRSSETNCMLKLDDCIIDDANVDILKQILLSNPRVKSIHSVTGKYHSEYDEINFLQCLNIGQVLTADYKRFTRCMLRNEQTLHTICICGGSQISALPLRSLHNLTSLSLSCVAMQHNDFHHLLTFLTGNVLMENIKFYEVYCDDHDPTYIKCHLPLNLLNHDKLTTLCLFKVNIICDEVNNSNIRSITLNPITENIESTYTEIFKCTMNSQLEHLYIDGRHFLGYDTRKHLTYMLETLQSIKSLKLESMDLIGDVLLKLHSGVTEVKIKPVCVTMTLNCFYTFIDSFVDNKSVIKVMLDYCTIVTSDEETLKVSPKESVSRMSRVLESKAIKITHKSDYSLYFETTGV